MHHRPFQQVDLFTATAYRWQPPGRGAGRHRPSTEEMQRSPAGPDLSEATFADPHARGPRCWRWLPRAHLYPAGELPFAGPPTLGTCHAWLKAGGQPQVAGRIVQECGVGLVNIRQQGEQLAFAAPPLRRSGPLEEADVALIHVAWAWRGRTSCSTPGVTTALAGARCCLASSAQVLALKPDAAILAGLDVGVVGPAAGSGASAPRGKIGVVGSSDADGIAFEVRAFFPGNNGLSEDPVTGSLNAALAQWLIGAGLAPAQYVAARAPAWASAGARACAARGRHHLGGRSTA